MRSYEISVEEFVGVKSIFIVSDLSEMTVGEFYFITIFEGLSDHDWVRGSGLRCLWHVTLHGKKRAKLFIQMTIGIISSDNL